MIDPSVLRELLEAVEVPGPYRSRVESYGPDAARSLIRLYDTLKEYTQDDPRSDAPSL